MKIAFLVTRLEKPSARYRILQYLPYIKEQGWDAQVFALPRTSTETKALFRGLTSFDVIFLQKKLLSRWKFSALRKSARKLVYDFDDAIMFRDSWKSRHYSLKRRWAFARTVQRADWVIAGNEYLKELALEYTERVSIIPTPIPTERYPLKVATGAEDAVTLGWIGSAATINYLEIIREVIDELAARFSHIRLKIVSDCFPSFKRITAENKFWSLDDEIADLHSFDIGLMPLTDDVWSRGKCGFKILQYMAAGIPVVCSPVGMNREIVKDGVHGYWAESRDEWIEKLSFLIKDPEVRSKMGCEGRKRVIEKYSLSVNARKLIEILNSL